MAHLPPGRPDAAAARLPLAQRGGQLLQRLRLRLELLDRHAGHGTDPSSTPVQFAIEYFQGNWWYGYNGPWFGYLPGSLWSGTFSKAGLVQAFGGVSSSVTQPCTDMGNGYLGTSASAVAVTGIGYFNLTATTTPLTCVTPEDSTLYDSPADLGEQRPLRRAGRLLTFRPAARPPRSLGVASSISGTLSLCTSEGSEPGPAAARMGAVTTLRLLSYNVRSMRDDVDALGRVMREIAPDVAIVQEAPRFGRWRYQCAALARRAGMVIVTGGRACGANLVLSSLAVDVLDRHELAFSADRRLHHRGSAIAVLRRAGSRFAVAGTHLDLIEAPRLRHLDELAAFTARAVPADVPLIVGGDINAVPGSATWQRLERFGTDAFAAVGTGDGFTYSALAPVRRIDAVFADQRLQLIKAETIDSADVRIASDHLPLVVEYLLGDAEHVQLPGQAE